MVRKVKSILSGKTRWRLAVLLVVSTCLMGIDRPTTSATEEPAASEIRLTDVTDRSGINFLHTDGGSGQYYIMESVVAGLALFDYDNDGLIDVYFLNGARLPGTVVDTPPRNALYRNNGDGTFTDVTDEAGVGCGELVGAGASFLDIDNIGLLDLYVANYVDFTYDRHIERTIGKHRFHPGPRDYPPMPDNLFRNNGDGTYTDISRASGIATAAGAGMGIICFDFDDDGYTDVFVCNDHGANFLFHNDGKGGFQAVGLIAGVAYDFYGNENGSMGADCGDYENNGRLDLFATNYSSEMPVLYRNLGDGAFEDTTRRAHAGASAFPHVTWGTGFVDFANRGLRDLFIACGHFMDKIEFIDDRTTVDVPNILLQNLGNGRFLDVSDRCGDGLAVVASTRGAAFDDLDNDGRIDGVLLNTNGPPTVLRNDSPVDHHWLQIRLRGTTSNRDGVGSLVRVVASDLAQVAEVHSGRGYQSHYGTRLHFGLGHRPHVDRIEVRWLGGTTEVFSGGPADRYVVLTEGKGAAKND